MNFLSVQRESQVGEGENWKISCSVWYSRQRIPLRKILRQGPRRERILASYMHPKRQEACWGEMDGIPLHKFISGRCNHRESGSPLARVMGSHPGAWSSTLRCHVFPFPPQFLRL